MKLHVLHPSVRRCRPDGGRDYLVNDCGKAEHCVRRLAPNTVGAPQSDLSVDARMYISQMYCPHFLTDSIDHQSVREARK